MLCVQLVGDSTVLEGTVAHCQLRRLKLIGDSTPLLRLLNGVKDNLYITYLDVTGEPITTCPHDFSPLRDWYRPFKLIC